MCERYLRPHARGQQTTAYFTGMFARIWGLILADYWRNCWPYFRRNVGGTLAEFAGRIFTGILLEFLQNYFSKFGQILRRNFHWNFTSEFLEECSI